MRFYLRKVVTYFVTVSATFLIIVNIYNHNLWVYEQNETPWSSELHARAIHKPKFVDQKFHDHILLERKPLVLNISRDGSEKVDKNAKSVQKPEIHEKPIVWQDMNHYDDDRIVAQMKHRPETVIQKELNKEKVPLKTILAYGGLGGWGISPGQKSFIEQKCPVNYCTVTDDRRRAAEVDAILFHHSAVRPWTARPLHQIWIMFMLESPYHTPGLKSFNSLFNWTATYRHDSDIVAPYEKFQYYNTSIKTLPLTKNYATGKTKKVAWFVSNCGARNGRRQLADELGKYIQVDIYGACGSYSCPRNKANDCFKMLSKEYKFYLSFENSNCRDYITEKFFVNGLGNDVIPIVMGAAPEDYARAAPPKSYIHVDEFESPKELADYLHKLDKDDDLYNEYFRWKGTGGIGNTFFWCRICSMLHEAESQPPKVYTDLEKWWRGTGVCISQRSWRQAPRTSKYIIENF